MHGIFAISDFVSSSGKWASVDDTLIVWVKISSSLSTVTKCVDGVLS